MGTPSTAGMGWPLLVASGRRRDYSTLLAPEFLVADLDYGILDTAVRPTAETDPATVIHVRTARGRQLAIAYATHLLTAGDLADAGLEVTGAAPRDEHGRPLRLIYGFASPGVWIAELDEADMSAARSMALQTYRRFLVDEERAAVAPSQPFTLRSRVVPARTLRAAASPLAPSGQSGHSGHSEGGGTDRGHLARGLVGAAIAAVIAVIVIAVVGIHRQPPPHTQRICASVAPTAAEPSTFQPSTLQLSTGPSPTCTPAR